jgi:hypothetical protein
VRQQWWSKGGGGERGEGRRTEGHAEGEALLGRCGGERRRLASWGCETVSQAHVTCLQPKSSGCSWYKKANMPLLVQEGQREICRAAMLRDFKSKRRHEAHHVEDTSYATQSMCLQISAKRSICLYTPY